MDDTENDEGDIQEYISYMFPGYRTHVFGEHGTEGQLPECRSGQ